MSARVCQAKLPAMEVRAIASSDAHRLFERWKHPLGPCRRPFGREDWVLEVDGAPRRPGHECLDCVGRGQCARPDLPAKRGRRARTPCPRPRAPAWDARDAPALDQDLGARWRYRVADLGVSYSMPGTRGNVYRFDGWINGGRRRPSGGSGTWTRARPRVNDVGDGIKILWVTHLAPPERAGRPA